MQPVQMAGAAGVEELLVVVQVEAIEVDALPAGGLLGAWQFWDGTGWSPDEARSARLASGVGTSFSVDRVQGRYVLVSMESHLTFNPAVVAYTADTPTGPFTDPVELFHAPEQRMTGRLIKL